MRQKKIKNVDEKIVSFSGPLIDDPAAYKERWREAFGRARANSALWLDADSAQRPDMDSTRRAPANSALSDACARAPLYLEIGCGKGRFIKESALKNPLSLFLGFEGQKSVLYRALQRAYVNSDVSVRELNEVALALAGSGGGGCASRGGHDARADDIDRGSRAVAGPPDNLLFCAGYISDMRDYFADGELDGVFLNFSDPWPKVRQSKRRLTSPGYLNGYLAALAAGGFIRFKTDSNDFFEYSRACVDAAGGFEITALTDDLHVSEYAASNETTEYEMRFLNLNKKIHYLEARKRPRLREVNLREVLEEAPLAGRCEAGRRQAAPKRRVPVAGRKR
ncbi:MAG: hypothetical protein LBS67_06100 [Clostridiales Family XIII bacterium]|jgi:tRNA (guanine-N7-)-methyltransferase|nr:hypothetical protein [Clostridiales Family XIII bacterium]